jgi:Rps23 Pro-64 3,4-dihydroxylase Tpa1-like proline 4-hydroxylase
LIRVFFTCEFASALAKSFPQEGFKFASYGGDSQGFYYRHLISNGVIHNSVLELEPSWKILAKLLASQEYARGLAELVGLRNVRGLKVDCALAVYNSGCWLKPHTDREHRILTQVIYLNDGWDPKFGGFLRLLNSERLDDVAEEVVPTLNTSVIFRRSDRSWHAVMPVHPEQGSDRKLIRRSVLFHLSSVGT